MQRCVDVCLIEACVLQCRAGWLNLQNVIVYGILGGPGHGGRRVFAQQIAA